MKGKKLTDWIGAACGVFLVAVLVVSIATGSLSSPAVAESGEGAPAAGTVLAVADAEHTGKAIAHKVETKSGVTVMHAAEWEEQYPEIYASLMKNQENDEIVNYLEVYPQLVTLYEPYGFSKCYGSARGHFYDVDDILETGRPHALANCWTCKTPDFTNLVNEMGPEAYQLSFDEVRELVEEGISCYSCHANTPGEITITHTYAIDAVGEDFDKIPAATLACGQCHNEYFFYPGTMATTLPHDSIESMAPEAILNFYNTVMVDENGLGFADYTNPRTGVRQLKAQHPEYETFLGAGSVHASMFTCADCHMEKVTKEDGTVYRSHTLMSPLKSETIMASCAPCHQDLAGFVHGIQEKMEARTIEIGNKLEELTNKLADAVASGKYTEEELDVIRGLNRKGLWYWDFVFVENSEGAHNSRLDNDCLDKAEAIVNEALALFK